MKSIPWKLLIVLQLLLATTPAVAATERDWQLTANTLLLIDWAQTRHIARSSQFYETNPILGAHPSSEDVDRYFAGSLLAINGLSALLPSSQRGYLFIAVAVAQAATVAQNQRIGIQMRW